jgi:hypothetical protein
MRVSAARIVRWLTLGAVGSTLATPAFADWTIGAFLGGSWTRDTSLTLTQPSAGTDVTLTPVHYAGKPFEAPPYYGYRAGVFPHSGWFGVEGEFIHLKVFAETTRLSTADGMVGGVHLSGPIVLSSIIQRFSISHGVNLLFVNALFRHQSPHTNGDGPRWVAVARAGAGTTIPHPESSIDGGAFEAYEWGAFAVHGAGAIELRVTGPLYVTGEYKLTRTRQNVTVVAGSVRTPLVTQHLTGGVMVRFARSQP